MKSLPANCLEKIRVEGTDGIQRLTTCGAGIRVEDVFELNAAFGRAAISQPIMCATLACERDIPHRLTFVLPDLIELNYDIPGDV